MGSRSWCSEMWGSGCPAPALLLGERADRRHATLDDLHVRLVPVRQRAQIGDVDRRAEDEIDRPAPRSDPVPVELERCAVRDAGHEHRQHDDTRCRLPQEPTGSGSRGKERVRIGPFVPPALGVHAHHRAWSIELFDDPVLAEPVEHGAAPRISKDGREHRVAAHQEVHDRSDHRVVEERGAHRHDDPVRRLTAKPEQAEHHVEVEERAVVRDDEEAVGEPEPIEVLLPRDNEPATAEDPDEPSPEPARHEPRDPPQPPREQIAHAVVEPFDGREHGLLLRRRLDHAGRG